MQSPSGGNPERPRQGQSAKKESASSSSQAIQLPIVADDQPDTEQHLLHDWMMAIVNLEGSIRPTPKQRPRKAVLTEEASEAWESVYDQMAAKRFERKGDKYRPEPPAIIAKVKDIGGELWLGGLPLEENMHAILEKEISIQIYCFRGDPASRKIKQRKSSVKGVAIPRALILQLNMDDAEQAQRQWPEVMRLVYISLYQGNNAYIHCMAGVHRAGCAGVLMRAILHGEDIKQALKVVKRVGQIDPWRLIRDFGPDRIGEMLEIRFTPREKTPIGWNEYRKLVHAMAEVEEGEPPMPLCTWNQSGRRAAERCQTKGSSCEFVGADGLYDWIFDTSKSLCTKCKLKMPASFLVVAKACGLYEEPA